jgi:hypothetical protein
LAFAFERLTASNLYLVSTFTATPNAEPWVSEVEEIAYGPGAAAAVLSGEVIGWLIYDDNTLIGMALQKPAGRYAELLHTVCINHPERGKHRGQQVLEAVVAHARAHSEFDYVIWLVHPQHDTMNTISHRVAPDAPQTDLRGNQLYTWP